MRVRIKHRKSVSLAYFVALISELTEKIEVCVEFNSGVQIVCVYDEMIVQMLLINMRCNEHLSVAKSLRKLETNLVYRLG